MYDVGCKLFNGIKSMCVESQAHVRVKGEGRVSGSGKIMERDRGVSCPLVSSMCIWTQ